MIELLAESMMIATRNEGRFRREFEAERHQRRISERKAADRHFWQGRRWRSTDDTVR